MKFDFASDDPLRQRLMKDPVLTNGCKSTTEPAATQVSANLLTIPLTIWSWVLLVQSMVRWAYFR
jgi:hypothetical protein